jgi:hypothetical protein
MLKALSPLLGAVLLAGTTALYAQAPAQTPPADAGKGGPHGGRHFDCKDAKDPAACTQRRDQMKAAYNKAYDACKGKATGDEFRACMQKQRADFKQDKKKSQ